MRGGGGERTTMCWDTTQERESAEKESESSASMFSSASPYWSNQRSPSPAKMTNEQRLRQQQMPNRSILWRQQQQRKVQKAEQQPSVNSGNEERIPYVRLDLLSVDDGDDEVSLYLSPVTIATITEEPPTQPLHHRRLRSLPNYIQGC